VRRSRWWLEILGLAVVAALVLLVVPPRFDDAGVRVKGHFGEPNSWTELRYDDGAAPAKRDNACMVYDAAVDRVILFGGNGPGGNDTWSYEPASRTWTELQPSGALPPGRYGPAYAVVDAPGSVQHGTIVVFGGYNHDVKSCLNDTWLYQPLAGTWKPALAGDATSAALPTPRLGGSLEYDPASGRLLMFGGWNAALYKLFNDLWAYDPGLNSWTELKPEGSLPPVRDGEGFARDPATGHFILFGGVGFDTARNLVELGDTWSYDPVANRWTELHPAAAPSPRDGMLMVYDRGSARMLLFGGGEEGLNVKDDTWSYDPAANVWTELEPGGPRPRARMNYNVAFDPTRNLMLLFGGAYDQWNVLLGDTWVYASGLASGR
jgi:N-acetylneuraminic acid mutarotase